MASDILTSEFTKISEMIERLHSGIADVRQSRERLEQQTSALMQQQAALELAVKQARQAGREDLVQQVMRRNEALQSQVSEMTALYRTLGEDEERLSMAVQKLRAKADALRAASTGADVRHRGAVRPQANYYIVNADRSQALHVMYSRNSSTPSGFWAGLSVFSPQPKETLCGRAAIRPVPVFSPEEATCRECRRRWEIATGKRQPSDGIQYQPRLQR